MSSDSALPPFDDEQVEAVASEHSLTADRLRELLAAHQVLMDRLPGVENLVYEWRKQFGATLIARSEAWYFVAAPEWAWDEFADDLEASDGEMAALEALHAKTVRNHADVDQSDFAETTPIVLRRE